MPVAAYLLAGGRSSRMGQDKAMLPLCGRTLLSIAVAKVRSLAALAPTEGEMRVTVLGDRVSLEGADRSLRDHHPRCGPLGGIEAALQDLTVHSHADLAFFLPVDMPFLPPSLLDALLREWLQADREGALACWCIVDGRSQPLVSLVHRSLYPFVVDSIRQGRYKVASVLQDACLAVGGSSAAHFVEQTQVFVDGPHLRRTAWSASPAENRVRDLWFANLNTPEEFRNAEIRMAAEGISV